jgi:methyltransferase (TIGR00027 family)
VKEKQASGTATIIAAALVMLHADPESGHLVSDFSEQLARRCLELCSRKSRWLLPVLQKRWFQKIVAMIEGLTVPGITLHYAVRKRCISVLAEQAVARDAYQAVVLGAGFDSLGPDLGRRFGHLRVWEIDHPATQRCKVAALESLGQICVRFVSADLANVGPQAALTGNAEFRLNQNTLWIAEGLLMYFAASDVARVFQQTAAMSRPGAQFLFTFMQTNNEGRLRFQQQTRLVDWWLRSTVEPFRWGSDPESLAEIIRPWRVLRILDSDNLKQIAQIHPRRRLAVGEMLCQAELPSDS